VSGPLIVAAEFVPADLAWLDALRRAHYPPDRNKVPAHLTLFHALPPSLEAEVKHQLAIHSEGPPPRATIAGPMDLGQGVALRVVSEELEELRWSIAEHFRGSLSAQDSQGWAPHVTIQNKVGDRAARALLRQMEREFRPRPLGIAGLSLYRYLGGPWERILRTSFRGA
jgi:hypothetical protein